MKKIQPKLTDIIADNFNFQYTLVFVLHKRWKFWWYEVCDIVVNFISTRRFNCKLKINSNSALLNVQTTKDMRSDVINHRIIIIVISWLNFGQQQSSSTYIHSMNQSRKHNHRGKFHLKCYFVGERMRRIRVIVHKDRKVLIKINVVCYGHSQLLPFIRHS